jgi:hypothetical protein
MRVARYTANDALQWDKFVEDSKNGTFLFLRGYMDYHSDRFADHSLMFYNEKGKLVALMPANEKGGVLYSHQGLTYGGFVLSPKSKTDEVGELFDITIEYLRTQDIKEWHYKQIPAVYHQLPAEEDEYWLWRHGAVMTDCNMMSAIDLAGVSNPPVESSRRNNRNRLSKQGYTIDHNATLEDFWPILTDNLQMRFGAKPVHSFEEMTLLMGRFPKEIKCVTVKDAKGTVMAGTILYITDSVVKTQYTSASQEGKSNKVLDMLLLSLIEQYRQEGKHHWFEFGTSMAENGIDLNKTLISQKEGFGARSIACRIYKISITS